MQAYFNQRLLPILTKHHKKMVGWDEILNPALPKDIMIQSWRGDASLADGATKGYTGILSAPYYLDAQKTSETMYLADPIPADTKLTPEQQQLILGRRSVHVGRAARSGNCGFAGMAAYSRDCGAILVAAIGARCSRICTGGCGSFRWSLKNVGLTHISGPQKAAAEPDGKGRS